jgi:phospholipase/lecithinase/hemolysin
MPWQDQLVGDPLRAAEEHDIEPLIHEAADQSVVWCNEVSTVKTVVDRLVTEAKQALEKLRA